MAISIPPPPTNSPQGDRVWTDWYIKLNQILSTTAGVAWALVDKTGSRLDDIASRAHSQLQGIVGTGAVHISATEAIVVTSITASGHQGLSTINGTGNNHISNAEAAVVTSVTASGHQGLASINGTGNLHISSGEAATLAALNTSGIEPLRTKAGDPGTGDIAAGHYAVYKNTSLGEIRLWVNDGGTMKKSATLT